MYPDYHQFRYKLTSSSLGALISGSIIIDDGSMQLELEKKEIIIMYIFTLPKNRKRWYFVLFLASCSTDGISLVVSSGLLLIFEDFFLFFLFFIRYPSTDCWINGLFQQLFFSSCRIKNLFDKHLFSVARYRFFFLSYIRNTKRISFYLILFRQIGKLILH